MKKYLTKINKLRALIIKEVLTLFRDPRTRIILIAPPILQLVIFAFAVTLEVKNVSLLVCNLDKGKHGYELIQRFSGSPTFAKIKFTDNDKFQKAIDNQKAMAAINIPQDFSRNINAGKKASVQLILDGRRSNVAQIINGYVERIVSNYNKEIQLKKSNTNSSIVITTRNWFNENLIYLWFTIPSLVGILGMLVPLIITSLSIARERELGTFDQILVSPLVPHEILIGKTIPAILIGMLEASFICALGVMLFKVPFTGSVLLFYLALFMFIISIVGAGLFISSLSKTQQQSVLGVFIFMVPVVTLSGYAAPVENMPQWLQYVTSINPLKYFLIISKGIFLKDMPLADVWTNTWPLLLIGIFTLSFTAWFCSKRLE